MNNLYALWNRRYRPYALALLCTTALVICTGLLAPSGYTQPQPARSADSFVDSIGINTHLYYDDSVYYKNYSDIIKPELQALGVRHIRDSAVLNYNGYLDRIKELGSLGIHTHLNTDPRGTTTNQALEVVQILGSAVESIEGPNEYDTYQYADSNWVNTVHSYQQNLYQTFKGNSDTAQLPVLAPSFVYPDSFSQFKDLNGYVDFGKMHNYPAGQNPGVNGYGGIRHLQKLPKLTPD